MTGRNETGPTWGRSNRYSFTFLSTRTRRKYGQVLVLVLIFILVFNVLRFCVYITSTSEYFF